MQLHCEYYETILSHYKRFPFFISPILETTLLSKQTRSTVLLKILRVSSHRSRSFNLLVKFNIYDTSGSSMRGICACTHTLSTLRPFNKSWRGRGFLTARKHGVRDMSSMPSPLCIGKKLMPAFSIQRKRDLTIRHLSAIASNGNGMFV